MLHNRWARKSAKTTNSLYLSDNSRRRLAVDKVQDGSHNDLYDIVRLFEEMTAVFFNADSGFDSEGFDKLCKQEEIALRLALCTLVCRKLKV